MTSLIVGDSPMLATRLRKALASAGHDCAISQVFSTQQAFVSPASTFSSVDFVFVTLPSHVDGAIETVQKVRSLTQLRIIAVGTAQESHTILASLHAGADYFIDEESQLDREVAHIVARLTKASSNSAVGRMFSITSAAGGTGCTLLAANLGVALAKRFKRCGVLDFSAGYGALADHLNLDPRHTLEDVLNNLDSLDQELLSQSLTDHSSGVSVLARGHESDDFDRANENDFDRIIQVCQQALPACIVDADRHTARRCHAIHHSERVLLVFRPDFANLCETRRLLDEWDRRQFDLSRVVLVANRCGLPIEISTDKARMILGKEIAACIPEDAAAAGLSINCGNPAILESPASSLSKAILKLAHSIIGANGERMVDMDDGSSTSSVASPQWLQRAASVFF